MLSFEWASRIETAGFKLAGGKGLREGWDSKELWKSAEKQRPREVNIPDMVGILDPEFNVESGDAQTPSQEKSKATPLLNQMPKGPPPPAEAGAIAGRTGSTR